MSDDDESEGRKCLSCGDDLAQGEICAYCNESALYWDEDEANLTEREKRQ
jgi:hypothetical protein